MNENPIPSLEHDAEVAGRLDTYASTRLDPSPEASARMRMRVMVAATRRRPSGVLALGSARRRWFAAALLAAVLVVAFVGTALGASPGSPLYPVRLWLETVTLPADADARAEAQLSLLGERVSEAQAAAAAGDGNAVAAALAAYRAEIEDVLATAGDDEDRLARLEAALGTHIVVLETLSTKVPEQARDAIANAIENSSKAVEHVNEHQSGGPDASPGPDHSPKPEPSEKPHHTPAAPDDHPSGGPPGQQP